MKVNELISRLEHAGITNATQETLWLISHVLGVSHSEVFARQSFSDDELVKIEAVISRRENHEPLQYILGEADFYGRDFYVGPGVLIPRHDTETLILGVKKIFALDEKFCFLDWGTGSGCIAITILLEFPNSFAYMLEKSPEAVDYTRKNLSRHNLDARADIISHAAGKFDLIISNPPYIPSREINGLEVDVRDYEPHSALDGGEDGMKFYAEIFALAKPGGYIILETGSINQVQSLKSFHDEFDFVDEIFDTGNFPRCLIFRRKV
ncbi:MAG: peptide chain release factor N(5)-glutamine methyltransferase [Synergistaceae bacterium]|nr:peptide chain release factor N(5)-glutamine methyltransferase [Synergistaceae bacterium]